MMTKLASPQKEIEGPTGPQNPPERPPGSDEKSHPKPEEKSEFVDPELISQMLAVAEAQLTEEKKKNETVESQINKLTDKIEQAKTIAEDIIKNRIALQAENDELRSIARERKNELQAKTQVALGDLRFNKN